MKKPLGWIWALLAGALALVVGLLAVNPRRTAAAGGVPLAVLLLGLGVRALGRSVAAEPAFAVRKAVFCSTAPLPPCLEAGIWKSLHRTHVAALPTSALDPDAAERIGKALAASPWVREVRSVDVDATPKVTVHLAFREPIAAVPWGGGVGYVDEAGVLLPKAYYRLTSISLPRIVGLKRAPPMKAGEAWNDPGLRAGLEVLRELASRPEVRANPAAVLDAIDVTNVGELRPEQPEVVCRTRKGIRLHFSVSGKPGRPSLEAQADRLGEVLRIDRNLALPRQYVELRFPRPAGL